ncbi:amidase family protein [Chelatococcus sambhunathii]|nr:amidase family protein [Chelatococcus sambhunathii]
MMLKPTLNALAEALASGVLTPTDLVTEALGRAAASKAAFIELFPSQAIAEAETATARRRAGMAFGPFDGIPFAVKDLFDVAGSVTTAGSRTRFDWPLAEADAALIARLRQQGLIPVGKTNLSEFAFSGLGLNPHFGTPTARDRPDRAPGGSSSGSAVALADGVVAFALGTDTAGSIRLPAAFNGLVGFRPSRGRYDAAGVFPLAESFDVPGPMANTVADVLILDRLMGGVSPSGKASKPPKLLLDQWLLDDVDMDSDIRSSVLAFTEQARGCGAHVDTRPVAAVRKAGEAIRKIGWLGGVEAAAFHRERLAGADRAAIDPRVVARLDHAAAIPHIEAETLRRLRIQLRTEISAELAGAVLVTPTTLILPPLLEPLIANDELFARTNLQALFITMIGSYLGMPGIALPVARPTGALPISVLLSAAAGDDELVLAAASWASAMR